jgi:hypothetical protein
MRLESIPKIADDKDPRRWRSASVIASVVTAHAELLARAQVGEHGSVLAVAWVRPQGSDRTHFLLGGRPTIPPRRSLARRSGLTGAEPVLFPPGATAEPVTSGDVEAWLSPMTSWQRCVGAGDVGLDDQPARGGHENLLPTSLDDYAVHIGMPFTWLVVAEPMSRELLEIQIGMLMVRVMGLRKQVSVETSRVDLARGERRMREYTRARASGLWRVHVLAAATSPDEAQRAASLLCSTADTSYSGHLLFPKIPSGSLQQAWADQEPGPDGSASPVLAGTELVTTLMRPPIRELPGIRLLAPYRFDVTPVTNSDAGGATLGDILDESLQPVGAFKVSYDTLNRHGFICGATGSGKSQTARRLLESLSTGTRRIPWLVVEPAKAEYASMNGRLEDDNVLVIRPGDLHTPPASLNPLEPEPGFPLQSHADLVRALFLAAFEANEPFPQVLSHALTDCYTAAGWDLVTGRLRDPLKPKFRIDEPDELTRPRYPTLRELQATARRVVDDIGYGREVAADVRGFVDVRMGSLRQGAPGRFFEGGHPLNIAKLLEENVVLELESITSDQDKAFLMGTVLIRLVEHLRVRQQTRPASGLTHVFLIEEAHRLLKNVQEGPALAAVELFASLLAEIRAYGEGVVVVEQIPSKILPDVLKNTAFKVMHRLPARDDREAVGATMNLSEANSEAIVAFPPGFAAVAVDGDDRPLLVRVEGGMERESVATNPVYPPLDGRRSTLCGHDCQTRACSLEEMALAAHAAEDPPVVVWAEAVAASIIIGQVPPEPRGPVFAAWSSQLRIQECTLASLAEQATDARRTQIQRWVDPDGYARHLAEVLDALLRDHAPPGSDFRRWRAGPSRWANVYGELRRAIASAGGEDAAASLGPHELSSNWMEHGMRLDAATLVGQFEQLKNDPAYGFGAERVVTGDIDASGLRRALVTLAGADSAAALERALLYSCRLSNDDEVFLSLSESFTLLGK